MYKVISTVSSRINQVDYAIIRRMSTEENNIQLESTEEVNENGKFKFSRRSLYSALLPVAFVTGLAAGYLFWGRDTAPSANPPAPGAVAEPHSLQ